MPYDVELLPPVVEFLRAIEAKLRAKAARTIELLRQFWTDASAIAREKADPGARCGSCA
jgi:hypothetical protein